MMFPDGFERSRWDATLSKWTSTRFLAEAKAELERHVWGTFVEGKASVALGGTGVVVSGCEACRKRFGTNSQYLRHLADDVLPGIIEGAFPPGVRADYSR